MPKQLEDTQQDPNFCAKTAHADGVLSGRRSYSLAGAPYQCVLSHADCPQYTATGGQGDSDARESV